MENELISAGWNKLNPYLYQHKDGRSLLRDDGEWKVLPGPMQGRKKKASKPQKYSTLKAAIIALRSKAVQA